MRSILLILALAAGCTRPLAGGSCADHKDEASCRADDSCNVISCPTCEGGTTFDGCYDKGGPQPGFACPDYCPAPICHGKTQGDCAAAAGFGCRLSGCCGVFAGCLDPTDPATVCTLACTNCNGLDESQCTARFDCRADYCPSCDPAHPGFVHCANPSEPQGDCAPPPCPPPQSCDQLADDTSCAARSDCHPVFEPAACDCALCCCTPFSHCVSGAGADCKGPALCNSAPPDCSNSACNGAFTVAYSNGCYEGCVHTTDCQ